MNNDKCLFCNIINKNASSFKVYEDDSYIAFLDIYPKGLGHTLILPKKHSNDLIQEDNKTLEGLGPIIKKISNAIDKALKPNGIIIRSNIRKAAGQVIFHTHVHILPVYDNKRDIVITQEIANKINKYIK